jgi:HK97 family phage major capsid protein
MSARKLGAELAEKQAALLDDMNRHKTADGIEAPQEKVEEWQAKNRELDELGEKFKKAKDIEDMAERGAARLAGLNEVDAPLIAGAKGGDGSRSAQPSSLGEMFVKSAYQRDRHGRIDVLAAGTKGGCRYNADVEIPFEARELKTTMTTAAGWGPENLRSGRVVLSAQREITLFDLVPMIPLTTGNAYTYMEETTFTNNAAAIAENDGTGSPESALALTERSVVVRNISTFLPITDEQLADVPGAQAYVDSRLSYMVRAKAEYDLLNADGNAPNWSGYYTQVTQSQAKGADPQFDAFFKAMTKVRVTGRARPDGIVIHPNDWQDIRLLRTTEGIYILGNPADPGPTRLFGIGVVETDAALEGTALVGDFGMYSAMVYRQGLQIKVSDSHSDYFIKHKQAIRANLRAALVVYRVAAFCEVTGL